MWLGTSFVDVGIQDLKNLRTQLYSAAEYFELAYTHDDQNNMWATSAVWLCVNLVIFSRLLPSLTLSVHVCRVVDTLKDYAIRALVNTVDHLGSVSYKVSDLLDEKLNEVSATESRVSRIEQVIRF